ncbi:hypothetical protein ANCCEY_09844 [Ancylostoma ceylanicum]|uniref:SCP domain-containing protein n=1 Tax=Ancylostoma ceylanicum TaxID=53326 RepID=A0A0D6LTT1_9BILA|nr:hypothetical protein ANCCEY_09844 [Ancylostoma ceylanicum]
MTDEMEETAVNMHNYYRRLIATGWAEDPKSVYAPRASKMNYLLAYEETTKVGCAVKVCQAQGNTIVACKYDGQPVLDDPIYTVGKPCSECSKNTNNTKCETDNMKALCVA